MVAVGARLCDGHESIHVDGRLVSETVVGSSKATVSADITGASWLRLSVEQTGNGLARVRAELTREAPQRFQLWLHRRLRRPAGTRQTGVNLSASGPSRSTRKMAAMTGYPARRDRMAADVGAEVTRSAPSAPSSPQSQGPVAGLLGVRPDEIERVRALFAASMLLGLGLVFFYGSANAIFLTRYDITVLPWVYIANALAVIVVGLGYGAWSARVPVARALVVLAGAMSVSVGGLWLWATLSDARVVAFLMAMWFRLLFIFAVLGLWEIASAVFDIRQAKRLFPAVALGMMVAFVIGGALTPIVSPFLGPVQLVGISALFFGAYTVMFQRLLSRFNIGGGHDAAVAPAGPTEILADRFSRRMVWMKTVTILLMYVTEYVFYEQSTRKFDSEASLAGFLGIFMGAMTIVMVLVTGLVSGRYISRFGIRTATMTLPAGMLMIALPAGLYGSLAGIDGGFFVLVCIALATNHVLGNAIAEPASAVLFQPMPKLNRMRVRLAVHGWLGSLALVLAGVLLLALNAMRLRSVAPLLYLVSGIALVGLIVAAAQYRDYLNALRRATTLAFADTEAHATTDLLDGGLLAEGHGTDDPGSALALAFMARSMADDPLRALLPVLSLRQDPDLVRMAFDSMSKRHDAAYAELVVGAIDDETLPLSMRTQALGLLTALEPEQAEHRIRTALNGDKPAVAIGAGLTDLVTRQSAITQLGRLAASPDAADRRTACDVIGQLDRHHLSANAEAVDAIGENLEALLADNDPSVALAALNAAQDRLTPDIANAVARHLRVAERRGHAVRALASGSADPGSTQGFVSAVVEPYLAELPDEAAAEVFRQVVGPRLELDEIVDRCLAPGMRSAMRCIGYELLSANGTVRKVRSQLGVDLSLLSQLTGFWRDLGVADANGEVGANGQASDEIGAGDVATVRAAVSDEFEYGRRSVYSAIAVEYERNRMRDIFTLALSGDEDDRANAIEALDVLLDADHRRAIIGALEPLDVAEASRSMEGLPSPRPVAEVLDALNRDTRLTRWTRDRAADLLTQLNHDGERTMNPTVERVLSLRRVDIFSTLSYETLSELADLVYPHSAPAGSVIITTGSVGQELYALVAGSVEVRTPAGRVRRLDQGTVFGELAIIDPAPRSATVTALTACELIVVPRSAVLALADRRPLVMAEIARVLARRLRNGADGNP